MCIGDAEWQGDNHYVYALKSVKKQAQICAEGCKGVYE